MPQSHHFLKSLQHMTALLSEITVSSVEQPHRSQFRLFRVTTLTLNVCMFFNIPAQRSGVRRMKAKVKVKVSPVISLGLVVFVCVVCEDVH